VEVASLPWAFTQHQPLGTSEFIKEAGCRGVRLDLLVLRELYRRQILEPFVHVSNRRIRGVLALVGEEPRHRGTRLQQLRFGRDRGRLSDPAAAAFRPRLRFDQADCSTARGWWNGLLYSWYQLLVCPELDGLLARRKGWRTSRGAVILRLPEPGSMLLDRAARLRAIAVVLTAAETRYLPVLDSDWLRLINPDHDEWQRYCYGFDPVTASAQLGYSADRARQDAEWLLLRARSLDPVGDSWSQLMRRAPARAWKDLKDAALSALDYRIAAEILLLFYEDLASRGQASPLPDLPRNGWHPLAERLSYRDQTLDQNLMELGISPHPSSGSGGATA